MSLWMNYVPMQLIYAQEIDDYYCEYISVHYLRATTQ